MDQKMLEGLQIAEYIPCIPPLLCPSKHGEELSLYLAISPTTVSLALIREEDRIELLVYYTSRVL